MEDTMVVTADAEQVAWLGGLGIRFLLDASATGGRLSIVEHPLRPRALAAPPHRHSREDEYSYVLRGRVGAMLGDDVLVGSPGDLIRKPRGQWHTFWNAGDDDASLLEIISPSGFDDYFRELIAMFSEGPVEPARIGPVAERYGLELDPSRIAAICQEQGLTFG